MKHFWRAFLKRVFFHLEINSLYSAKKRNSLSIFFRYLILTLLWILMTHSLLLRTESLSNQTFNLKCICTSYGHYESNLRNNLVFLVFYQFCDLSFIFRLYLGVKLTIKVNSTYVETGKTVDVLFYFIFLFKISEEGKAAK